MLALTLSIITETFPPATRAGAIGAWAAIGGTGFGAGPVAGGILLTFFGWASAFWVNLPFAVVGVVGTVVAVRVGFALWERRSPDAMVPPELLHFGAGFGTLLPGTTHVAMRDVPGGVSGAASGGLNASRQIGTSVGLAVLGAIGVTAAVADS